MPQVTFKDARSFSLALGKAGKELPEQLVSQIQRKILLDSLGAIVRRTPVDTGHARHNWQVTTGTPDVAALDGTDKTGALTQARGRASIAALPPYVRAFVSNSLPYIEVLEFGGYPPPGNKPIRIARFKFRNVKRKDGSIVRKRVKLTDKTRAKLYQAGGPKVTAEGFSTQAPRGMVGITFEEAKAELASLRFGGAE